MVSESALEAAKVGNLPLLESLKSNQSLNERLTDSFGATCVHYAARSGNLDVLIFLVEKCDFSGSVKSKIGATPAHDAAATGHLECLQWLLKNTECSVNDKDASGAGPLHLAARFGHNHIVKYLLEETLCSATESTSVGAIPLHFAAIRGNINSVRLLIKHAPTTVNAQMKNGVTAAYLACQEGYLSVLKYLVLQAGASVAIPASDGMTCVHSAAQNGILDVLIWLIVEQGCDVNCRDKEGTTAIHFAASRGHAQVLRWLLLHGGRILLDNLNGTPLHDAAEHGQMESISILLDHGCDASIADNNLLTAAELADHCLHRDCSAHIRKHLEKFPGDHKIPPPPESPAPTLQPNIFRMTADDGGLSPQNDRLQGYNDLNLDDVDLPPTSSPRMVYHDKNRMPSQLEYRGITHIEDHGQDAEHHYVNSRRASNTSVNQDAPTISLQERAAAYQHSVSNKYKTMPRHDNERSTNQNQGKILPNQGQSLIQDFSYVPRRLNQSRPGTSSPSSGIHSNCTTPNDENPYSESFPPSSVNIMYYENLRDATNVPKSTSQMPRLKCVAPPPPPVFYASRNVNDHPSITSSTSWTDFSTTPLPTTTSTTSNSVSVARSQSSSMLTHCSLLASSPPERDVCKDLSRNTEEKDSNRCRSYASEGERVAPCGTPPTEQTPKSAFEMAILRQKTKMEGNTSTFENRLEKKLSRDQTPPPPPPCPPPAPPTADSGNKKVDPKDPDQCVRPSKLFGAMQKNQGKKPNPDLIEELKNLNVTSLKKVQKTSPVVFDSGSPEPPVGPNILHKTARTPTTPTTTPSEPSPRSMEDVPTVDKNGREIPEWRRQLMARQKTEKNQAEQAEMTKKAEEDRTLQSMPPWKRDMILKKRAETDSKKVDEPKPVVTSPVVEDDPEMPPWKREFLSRKKNNQS